MDPLTGTMIAATAISTITSFLGSKKASKAAKKQAAEEARMEKIVTDEKIRRLDVEERVLRGETLAGYAGGGVRTESPSPQTVLAEQAKEFLYEKVVTSQVGASKVSSSLQKGSAVADQYRYSGYANVASNISNLFANLAMTKTG